MTADRYITPNPRILQSTKHQSSINVSILGYPPAPRPCGGYEFGYIDPVHEAELIKRGWKFYNLIPNYPPDYPVTIEARASTPADGEGGEGGGG